jgi:hypothetical protein
MPNFGDDNLIRNVGKAPPALVISQEPGTAAAGNPALQLNQADPNGPALLVKSAGSLLDLQNVAGVSQFKVGSGGNVTAAGVSVLNLDLLAQPLPGVLAATMPQRFATTASAALTSGTVYLTSIPLPAGLVVSKCTMFTNTTAKSGGTHGWYVLVDASMKVLAVTADQVDAATVWGSIGTGYPLSFTAPATIPATARYYAGIMVAGTTPTITSAAAVAAGITAAQGVAGAVVLSGPSSSGQTTPPAVNASLTAVGATSGYNFYAYLE